VVFVDVDQRLVKLLNEKQYYTVVIKRDSLPDEERRIGPVRAVDGRNTVAVSAELAGADMAGTSVGKAALPKVLPAIARGLAIRFGQGGLPAWNPLNIIIAENDREAPALFCSVLSAEPGLDHLDKFVGLVETSIGKMVPIMKAHDLAKDPLLLFAEEYETLIVDKRGFCGPLKETLTDIPGLCPVDPIAAYVDRKLFIHNLGHAAAAYLGYAVFAERENCTGNGGALTIPEALALGNVEEQARQAMNAAAAALALEYPNSYSRDDLTAHIDELLFRFKNRSLGDTVHRVGRDLRRKLSREDRITGAMLLCAKHGLPFEAIAEVYRAALKFTAPAEDGTLFPADNEFRKMYELDNSAGADCSLKSAAERIRQTSRILQEVSGLDSSRPEDDLVIQVTSLR
jgi:mannitol-1-phosphate 5-dehydrogenase